jgi:hypothetical protein
MRETPFTKSLRKYVKDNGGGSYKLGASVFLAKGIPDTVFFLDKKTFFLESKIAPNKATPIQLAQIDYIRNSGGFVWVCTLMKDGIIKLDDLEFQTIENMFNWIKEYIKREIA